MNKTASITPGEKKRHGLVLFQLLIVIGVLVITWFSFGQNVLTPQKQAGMPERLGALKLASRIEGSEAIGQISKLHDTDIKLVAAYVASYARSNERVTVWVGTAESSDSAAELTKKMAEGVARGNSGFGNLKRLTIVEHDVFQVEGAGGKHFFYHSREPGERVVWLSIEASDTMPILEEAVKTF